MEDYEDRVKEILQQLVQDNSDQSRTNPFNEIWANEMGRTFSMKPYFSTPSLFHRLAQKVKMRLDQCGWKDEVRLECTKIIRKKGLENVTSLNDLVQEVTPYARSKVPVELKKEMVSMLKDALLKELEGTNLKP